MAEDTPSHYRDLVIYQVYVRNHGPNGTFSDPLLQAAWFHPDASLYGLFNVSGVGVVAVDVPDGTYTNLLDGESVFVEDGMVEIPETAVVFHYVLAEKPKPVSLSVFQHNV